MEFKDRKELRRFFISYKKRVKERKKSTKEIYYQRIKDIQERSQTTTFEKELYKIFESLVENDVDEFDSQNKPLRKFRFRHLDKLSDIVQQRTGKRPDVIICYGKKGIGKTVQIGRHLNDLFEESPQNEVVLMRNTVNELDALKLQLSKSKNWPIRLIGDKLFHKKLTDEEGKPLYVGFACALTGNSMAAKQGSEYPNIRTIIWDECTNRGGGEQYGKAELDNWITFCSSVIRDKKNVRIMVFGNLMRNRDGTASDVLLDSLLIPFDFSLKLIEYETEDGTDTTNVMAINFGRHYAGIESQKVVGLFSGTHTKDLQSNKPETFSTKVIDASRFILFDPLKGIAYSKNEDIFMLFIGVAFNPFTKLNHYAIYISEFDYQCFLDYKVGTIEMPIFNSYSEQLHLMDNESFKETLQDLYEMGLSERLHYYGDTTEVLFRKHMNAWEREYDLGTEDLFEGNTF